MEEKEKQPVESRAEKLPVQLQLSPDKLTAVLSGEIDHHSARQIREEIDLTAMRVRPPQLILDFRAVRFMDSSGIGLILGRCKLMSLWHGHVTVCNLQPRLERLASLAGLQDLCDFSKEEIKYEGNE